MNTVLVLVMLILILFALKEGMMWVALGLGLVMVVVSTSNSGASKNRKFLRQEPDLPQISPMKEQMLNVKYQPRWDGNNWWEEMADHWGSSVGRTIGLIR